jgi:hypothetical protein
MRIRLLNTNKIKMMRAYTSKTLIMVLLFVLFSCDDGGYEIEYAPGYPDVMAGNWVVFEFQGATLDGRLDLYDMSTALAPNDVNTLVLDNLYNSGTRIKTEIVGDTGFFAIKTQQLDVINEGGFGIKKISISGYINDNELVKDLVYNFAQQTMENMSFTRDNLSEIIFYRAGFYDQYNSLIDTVMVFGYRKTGFEDENIN